MNEYLYAHQGQQEALIDPNLFDTKLSERGILDATKLNDDIRRQEKRIGDLNRIELLVSSPLSRALHTSEIAFGGGVIREDIPRLVLPLARERLYLSSDVGRHKAELAKDFPAWNYELLEDNQAWWYVHPKDQTYEEWRPEGVYAIEGEPPEVFKQRMRDLRQWLHDRPEKVICLVCHFKVCRALTGIEFGNCDVRFFQIDELLQEPLTDLLV